MNNNTENCTFHEKRSTRLTRIKHNGHVIHRSNVLYVSTIPNPTPPPHTHSHSRAPLNKIRVPRCMLNRFTGAIHRIDATHSLRHALKGKQTHWQIRVARERPRWPEALSSCLQKDSGTTPNALPGHSGGIVCLDRLRHKRRIV